MAGFTKKIEGKKTLGNKQINSDEAIGLFFGDVKDAKLVAIKLGALLDNPYQPRLSINEDHIQELANSIEQSGLLQPIVVTPFLQNPNQFYIVAGHRRTHAFRALNRDTIDAIIINMDDEHLRLNALIENLQRENLTSLEEAFAIKSMIDIGMKQVVIAEKLGKSKGYVSQFVKISELDQELIDFLKTNNLDLNASLLYELTSVKSGKQLDIYKQIDHRSMNREEIRSFIKQINEKTTIPSKHSKKDFAGFELKQSKDKSKIQIKLDMNKLEDRSNAIQMLESLLEQLKND